ncbi:hypothetical protein QBC39DRAFT_328468 [Podospora conica]|nr:hypothetical protein QBC39DRAFT_328468 [Schizothecium conicum]
MVDIRDLLRNQETRVRQTRTQFWKDALDKQEREFLDKVAQANKDLIRNQVALLRQMKSEIAAQLGEDAAATLIPEEGAAGIAEKLLDACAVRVVEPYMDGAVKEEEEEGDVVEMDVDGPDVGSASGIDEAEADLSRAESLYEPSTNGLSKSSSPKTWAEESSSDDDLQIIAVKDVSAHLKGEPESKAKVLWEIQALSRLSSTPLRSSLSPEIQTKSGAKSKRYRATSSRAGGIGPSRPIGFEQLWKTGALISWEEVKDKDYVRCTYHGIAHENLKRSYYIVRCRNNANDSVHHFKVSPFKSNSGARGGGLHTIMAHLGRPSPYDPPCHDVEDRGLPLDWKSACRRYGIEVTMPHPPDTAEGIAMNEYIMIKSNRTMMYQFHRQEAERKEREGRENRV